MSGYTFIKKKESPSLKTSVYAAKISINLSRTGVKGFHGINHKTVKRLMDELGLKILLWGDSKDVVANSLGIHDDTP